MTFINVLHMKVQCVLLCTTCTLNRNKRTNTQDKPRLLSDTPVADDDEESAGEMTGML